MATQTQTKKKQSIFPDFPRESPVVDKNGDFGPIWHLGFSTLFQQLQKNFTNEGLQIPQLSGPTGPDPTAGDITKIQDIYQAVVGTKLGNLPNISGKIVYDYTNNVPKVFIIEFATVNDPSSNVQSASWKTFTIV